ncbi:MAG TPA: rhodanese-like domain-containing protein [Syntrophales bacterium]|nr:rhodanese-like domain-containing protein [Syntrophales bacterium]HOX94780.1 rhodanese-like domain-containing protein [Syntrophales bacterium]HPI57299.1 rhodanese-like domain-containing protein [Syntrophales bacterium]HPN25179.1 rhodanese-like domain-containing protein [Syntrophales bacterium]HQM29402.1 rhodanese-like domain-containing protein [Syntrophales bacterium]
MRKAGICAIGLSLAFVLFLGDRTFSQPSVSYENIPRMTKEELKTHLGKSDVVILDVRLEKQWESSDAKIPGASHLKEADVKSWAKTQDRNRTYVLY